MTEEYTVGKLFFETAKGHPRVLAQIDRHRQPEVSSTYQQLASDVESLGAGFISLGVEFGDKVALFSDNRPRWLTADLALLGIGAIDVPRGTDSATPEFEYILDHSDAIGAIIQDAKLLQRLHPYHDALRRLRFIVMMDDSAASIPPLQGVKLLNFEDVMQMGSGGGSAFRERFERVKPSDPATIVYTSGTTGTPKGVMLSHRNLTHQAIHLHHAINMVPGDIQVTILPPWHAYERAAEYFGIREATTLLYTDKRHFRDDMRTHRPHLVPCVPRMWETVYEAIQTQLKHGPAWRRGLFSILFGFSQKYVRARRVAKGLDARRSRTSAGKRLSARLQMLLNLPFHLLGHALIYHKIRMITGGRMKAAVSGGGSLAPYLDEFFEIVGVVILNGYGLTETAPVLTIRTLDHNVRGTIGLPLSGIDVQIRSEEGEILPVGSTGVVWARGPGIMMGYYKNDEGTRAIVDRDGWLNTGDLGHITITGDVVITGRLKDTIVLASGENVEPEPVESVARKSLLVSQIIVVGQDQKAVAALVHPNRDRLVEALGKDPETPIEQICQDKEAVRLVRDDIAKAMHADGGSRTHEQIGKVALIAEPFTEANGLLTQTMKPRRNHIMQAYRDDIERLFA